MITFRKPILSEAQTMVPRSGTTTPQRSEVEYKIRGGGPLKVATNKCASGKVVTNASIRS